MPASFPDAGRLPAGYEFVRLLGEGGNGWVALARQVKLNRLVAIKMIHADISDDESIARLRREGRAIASLRHPNVVSVYELLVSPAGIALVMEHVPGGDLRAALDENRLTGSHAVELLCDTAAALEHAAGRGLVHRDVKPANVLITANGRAKLADFGLARLPRGGDSFRTLAGGAAGTARYMAPEQIENPDLEAPTIDAYAFAVMAYEVLVGARPFAGNDVAALVYAHLYGEPISPWTITPTLPQPVAEILLGGLAKAPGDRPTPMQLAQRLTAIAPGAWDEFFSTARPTPGHQPTTDATVSATNKTAYRPPPPAKRYGSRTRPRLVAIAAGIAGGVIVGVLVAVLLLHR